MVADWPVKNGVELLRCMHHSMNCSEPPPNYQCGAGVRRDQGVYSAPGGQTLVAMFTVSKHTVRANEEVHNTEDDKTWTFINAVRQLQDATELHVQEKRPASQDATNTSKTGGRTLQNYNEQFLSPLLLQLLCGAPTLAILLAESPAALADALRSSLLRI